MPRLFVIGDSISIQYGPYLEAYTRGSFQYARKSGLEAALQNLDIPTGANGGDSSMVLSYLQALQGTGEISAEILLLNCGLHDIKRMPPANEVQVPLAQYAENLRQIIPLARTMAPHVVWVLTTPVDDAQHLRDKQFTRLLGEVQQYNAAADEIMQSFGVPVADLYTFTSNIPEMHFLDGVHYPEPIRARQAAFLAGYLQRFWQGQG